MSNYSGADWLTDLIGAENISPFGTTVANILGDVFLGIYHMNTGALRTADWKSDTWISVTNYGGLSTFDTDQPVFRTESGPHGTDSCGFGTETRRCPSQIRLPRPWRQQDLDLPGGLKR